MMAQRTTLFLIKPEASSRLGILLEGGPEGPPRVLQLSPGGVAIEDASARSLLVKGNSLLMVNGTAVKGHEHATRLLKKATGTITLHVFVKQDDESELATSDVTLLSHTHGRERRSERGIDKRDSRRRSSMAAESRRILVPRASAAGAILTMVSCTSPTRPADMRSLRGVTMEWTCSRRRRACTARTWS
jgi:hypothetical protein